MSVDSHYYLETDKLPRVTLKTAKNYTQWKKIVGQNNDWQLFTVSQMYKAIGFMVCNANHKAENPLIELLWQRL